MTFLPLDARRSQLIVTLGPASIPHLAALAEAGATAFRINASHSSPGEVQALVARVRRDLSDAPVVVDLQGGKMRVGELAPRALRIGDTVELALAPDGDQIPLPHPELFAAVRPGDTLSADDDRLRLRVRGVSGGVLSATVLLEGVLKPRKGVNVVEHPVVLTALTARDQAFLAALSGLDGVAWAFSFMRDGAEAGWIRVRAPGLVVGKIELADAVAHLPDIDQRVDATWICRGDLGAQLGPARLARTVAALDPRRHRAPMIMAGQVLEHLTQHAEPTRSEVCHLHDLVARGYAGIVLSDETAIGRDPVGAVQRAATLLGELGAASDGRG